MAGFGTRLLPATKEQPKEMLSVFSREGYSGRLCLKPLLHLVFEQLCDAGFTEFCFVVGRGKRIIEDHFTPDYGFVELMEKKKKIDAASNLRNFYRRVEEATIVWINQPEPRGFGDAVLRVRPFVGEERMLVHAGDTYIVSNNNAHLERLLKTHKNLGSDATLLLQKVSDPRQYGVAEVDKTSVEGVFKVKRVVEKPEEPSSKLAIMPIYIFEPTIFKALDTTPPGKGGELQLTDAIQKLIGEGRAIYALKLASGEVRLDIGTSETYWEALKLSYQYLRYKK